MFWKFATTSNIESILEREDVTLRDLMDDDDILQECKGQNTKLVKFLCQPDIIEELVSLIITDPASDADDALKYKYPNIACELLTSDVPHINDMLGDTESLREKLFSFLDNDTPLNPLLASFFSKVIGILLSRKAEPTLDYIKSKSDFLGCVLKHLGTSAIMDLLLRLVTCVESTELRAQVLSWLNENKLIERLIGLIDPSSDEEFHCNSAQSLCDIIRLSREHMYSMQESAQDDPLLNTLEKKETVQLLLHHMFDKDINESVIVNGISVLLALLEIRRPAPFGFPEMAPELTQLDVERLASGVSKTLHGLSDHLSDFHKLLEAPPQRDPMHCTFGELDPPLGNTRLHVGKLLSAILITNTHNMNVQLSELQIFNVLLDLFFRYEYNNFLHTQVVQCIQTVLSNAVTITTSRAPVYSGEGEQNTSSDAQKEEEDLENPRKLFEDCRLIQRILDAWEDNKTHETEAGGHRKGNMGHLTIITNQIIENMEKGTNAERIHQFIEGMPEEDQGRWQKFVAEPLAEMNEKNSRELGGHNPMHFSSDDDADADYNIPFANSAQQAFTDYQLQQITSTFIDQFGFTEGDFADQDDASSKFDKINSIDFTIKADTNTVNQDLVSETYHTRITNLGDSSDDDDPDKLDSGEDGDDDWDVANNDHISSPFKYGSEAPTVTIRPRSDSGGSSSSGEEVGTSKTSPFKIPVGNEDMEINTQGGGWQADFGDSDDSGSSNSTPSTSPRSGGVSAPPDFDSSLWSTAPNVGSVESSQTREDWANFDNIDCFASHSEDVFESLSASNADTSTTQAEPRVDRYREGEEKTQSENMEVGTSSPVDAPDKKSETSPNVTSLSDVVMEIQEDAPADPPSAANPVSDVTPEAGKIADAQEGTAGAAPEAVAMETDEELPQSAPASDPTETEEEENRLPQGDDHVRNSSLPSPCQDTATDESRSDKHEAESDQAVHMTDASKTVESAPSAAAAAESLHIEGGSDAIKTEVTPASLPSAANGDGASVPSKADVDGSDAPQVQLNGPV